MQELAKIDKPSQAIVLYKITPKEIAERLKEYDQLKVIEADTKSYKKVRSALTSIITTRVEVDKRRKQLGEDARKLVSNINQAAKMLIEPMTPYEDRFKSELNTEDDRKAEIKSEKEAIEQARVDKIRSRINDLQAVLITIITLPSNKIQAIQMEVESIEISVIDYMEFTEEAERVKANVLNTIQDYMKVTIENEKEDAERKIEAERFEKIRVEQEVTQKKIDEANQKLKEKEAILEKKEWERTEKIRIAKEMEEEKVKVEKEQEVEAERLEKDIAEQNRLKPDKERLIEYADKLFNITHPNVKAKSSKELLIEMNNRLFKLITGFKNQINKL